MKKFTLILIASVLLLPATTWAQETLDELLREVEQAASEEARIDQQRLQAFQRERNQQQQLLNEARQQLRAEEQRTDRLNAQFDANEQQLAELEIVLDERLGNLGELFGVVRQVAGDMRATMNDSMVSAQLPGRAAFFADLAERSELPTVAELRELWTGMVREVAESGKVVEFNSDIINSDGDLQPGQQVVRIGVFNAISDGRFLQWDSEQNLLLELPRQPAGRFQSMAADLQNASPGSVQEMAVDFTRGDILAQVVRAPDLRERLRQGGTIGWVIVIGGLIAFLFSVFIGLRLIGSGLKINRQVKRSEVSQKNALGRVLSVYEDNPNADVETLELKLDEAILRETPPLEFGLPIIKVAYVVAPLVGLLGTVLGMILTFQQITLFGTGDPRMMAGGISMALITTVLGLVVAIPLTLIHSILQSYSRSLVQVLEEQSAGIIARKAEQHHGSAI